MPRPSKIEVSAMNIRIPSEEDRDYSSLLSYLANIKQGVRVYGNSYVGISYYSPEHREGILSKYSEIDVDGDWFDIEDFGIANPDDVEDINIPEKLRPNYAAFYFVLDVDMHLVVFETYSESKSLSSNSVERYFKEILARPGVRSEFGRVESDAVKSFSVLEELLDLQSLKELRLVVRKPNPIDVGEDLANEIEERLVEQDADEYEETLRSKDEGSIKPSDRTRRLAIVASENGAVKAKSIVNGVSVDHKLEESPLKEVETFQKDDEIAKNVFLCLADRLIEKVRAARQKASGQESAEQNVP